MLKNGDDSVVPRIRERFQSSASRDDYVSSPSKGPHSHSHEFDLNVGACCHSSIIASMNPLHSYGWRKRWVVMQRLVLSGLIALFIAVGLIWSGDSSSRSALVLNDLSAASETKYLKLKTSWRRSSPLNNPHSLEQIKEAYSEMFDVLPPQGFDSNFTSSNCWVTRTVVQETGQVIEKLQCIPSLYLIGVAKSGTTDIWMRLSRHPDFARCKSIGVCGHNVKEPHFWTLGDRHIYWRDSVLGYQPMRYKTQPVKNTTNGKSRNAGGSPNYQVKLDFQSYVDFYKGFTSNLIKSPNRALIDASTDIFTFCCSGFPGPSEPLEGNKTMKLEDFITTPEIMKAIIPNPRFLLLLRDPVTRLWSDYMYFNRSGNSETKTPETFHRDCETAVVELSECLTKASEIDGLDDLPLFLESIGKEEFAIPKSKVPSFRAYLRCTDNGGWRDPEIAPPRKTLLQCPLHVSLYYYNMQFWMSTFDEEFMVIRTEDYRASPWTEIDRVFDHFGLREPSIPEWRMIHDTCNKGHCNEGKYHKSSEDKSDGSSGSKKDGSNGIILQKTEDMLREFYAPFNEHLAILINDEGFLWTADQIKEDKMMAEVALQSDPMEIILQNAEEKKKDRRAPHKNSIKGLDTLKSKSISTSESIPSVSNRDNKHKRSNSMSRSERSSRFFMQRSKDSNYLNRNEKRDESYLSILYRNGNSKYAGFETQDPADTNSNIQVTQRVDKIQIGNAVTGRVSSRPKD